MSKAQYIGVSGVARKVKQPHVGVSSVARKCKSGFIGVGGVARQFFQSGVLAGSLSIGASVYLIEDGTPIEYLVINQGIPSSSSLYDSSCNGTWLLRKDIIGTYQWDGRSIKDYSLSAINKQLNSAMLLNKFDPATQSIIKQVKIPYYVPEEVKSGSNGLSCKVFLLSGYEVGFTTSTNKYFPIDGAAVSYFNGAANSKRIAYYGINKNKWWLRSTVTSSVGSAWSVGTDGSPLRTSGKTGYLGIRPALILPSNVLFNPSTMQIIST